MAYQDRDRTALVDQEQAPPVHARLGPSTSHAAENAERKKAGVRDLIGGGVLIGIGFAFGGSVFLGTADSIDWVFDLLGSFWVLKGIYLLAT